MTGRKEINPGPAETLSPAEQEQALAAIETLRQLGQEAALRSSQKNPRSSGRWTRLDTSSRA